MASSTILPLAPGDESDLHVDLAHAMMDRLNQRVSLRPDDPLAAMSPEEPWDVCRLVMDAMDPRRVDDSLWDRLQTSVSAHDALVAEGLCRMGLCCMPTMTRSCRFQQTLDVWTALAQALSRPGYEGAVARNRFSQTLGTLDRQRVEGLFDGPPAMDQPMGASRSWSDGCTPEARYPTGMLWCEGALRLCEALLTTTGEDPETLRTLHPVTRALATPLLEYWSGVPEGQERLPLTAGRLLRTLDALGGLGAIDRNDVPRVVERVARATPVAVCVHWTWDTHASLRMGLTLSQRTVLPLLFSEGIAAYVFDRPVSPSHWARAIGTGPSAAPRAQRMLEGQAVEPSMVERLARLRSLDPASRALFESQVLHATFQAEAPALGDPRLSNGEGPEPVRPLDARRRL